VSERISVLAVEWDLLRRAVPGLRDGDLALKAFDRGLELTGDAPRPADVGEELRQRFAWQAAEVALHRYSFVTQRRRFAGAEAEEAGTFQRHLELERELVPPLKEQARSLRAEVRRLEGLLRSRGVDPDGIEPTVDWRYTLAVDSYAGPRYENDADRRKAVMEFFRRVGGE
jgi:hypothetical protein